MLNVPCFMCRLDVGEGKDLDLKKCPRSELRQQCIRYLGPVGASVLVIVFDYCLLCAIHLFSFMTFKFYPILCLSWYAIFFTLYWISFCLLVVVVVEFSTREYITSMLLLMGKLFTHKPESYWIQMRDRKPSGSLLWAPLRNSMLVK